MKMKRGIIIITFAMVAVFLAASFASATIIINQQPDKVYNLGDTISIPVTVKSVSAISGSFQMDLICNGHQVNFYKNGVGLTAGEEKKMETFLVLTKNLIGEVSGDCKIKGTFGGKYVLSSEFRISTLVTVQLKEVQKEFSPGDGVLIEGDALKEDGKDVDGLIDLEIVNGNLSVISQSGTVNNGFFSLSVNLPKDMAAGEYLVKLSVYEQDFDGSTTNHGATNFNLLVKQIPTNMEIVFENSVVEPGTNLRVKAVLHDQTGENIDSSAIITIKDKDSTILEKTEKQTDEFLDYPIAYNEPPANWTVVALSNKITGEASFQIGEKESVSIELINRTITITNTGNVPYNNSVSIKIGNESKSVDVFLGIDESKKYVLTAPDGEYDLEIIADGGNQISQRAVLTGRAVEVKEASGALSFARYSFVWIFIIAIMGFVAFIVFKKGYKKSFFGYIPSYLKKKGSGPGEKLLPIRKGSLIKTNNRAEVSLSIKGDKQNASVVCLKIKNLKEIESDKSNAEETLQKIVDFSEGKKAVVYENHENLFFIFAPSKTKTFRNEKSALEVAQSIKEKLVHHNRLFRKKIDFGISLNYGTIVAKQEKESMKFMSMGTLITTAKKIASLSEGEILIGDKINSRMGAHIKTEKHEKDGAVYYTIKEVKDSEQHKKFLDNFVSNLERDKKKQRK